ncbi:hypothetical protein HK100_012017 [Physocladia obscura]|uniref:Uncharacterized protein n=1 Tax=Physocladia obscura TaxID=109957 RepID=A0AAD5XG83_9FUNG|nr:hypothetical protein HK100_012017 [Physocladia obscura]
MDASSDDGTIYDYSIADEHPRISPMMPTDAKSTRRISNTPVITSSGPPNIVSKTTSSKSKQVFDELFAQLDDFAGELIANDAPAQAAESSQSAPMQSADAGSSSEKSENNIKSGSATNSGTNTANFNYINTLLTQKNPAALRQLQQQKLQKHQAEYRNAQSVSTGRNSITSDSSSQSSVSVSSAASRSLSSVVSASENNIAANTRSVRSRSNSMHAQPILAGQNTSSNSINSARKQSVSSDTSSHNTPLTLATHPNFNRWKAAYNIEGMRRETTEEEDSEYENIVRSSLTSRPSFSTNAFQTRPPSITISSGILRSQTPPIIKSSVSSTASSFVASSPVSTSFSFKTDDSAEINIRSRLPAVTQSTARVARPSFSSSSPSVQSTSIRDDIGSSTRSSASERRESRPAQRITDSQDVKKSQSSMKKIKNMVKAPFRSLTKRTSITSTTESVSSNSGSIRVEMSAMFPTQTQSFSMPSITVTAATATASSSSEFEYDSPRKTSSLQPFPRKFSGPSPLGMYSPLVAQSPSASTPQPTISLTHSLYYGPPRSHSVHGDTIQQGEYVFPKRTVSMPPLPSQAVDAVRSASPIIYSDVSRKPTQKTMDILDAMSEIIAKKNAAANGEKGSSSGRAERMLTPQLPQPPQSRQRTQSPASITVDEGDEARSKFSNKVKGVFGGLLKKKK